MIEKKRSAETIRQFFDVWKEQKDLWIIEKTMLDCKEMFVVISGMDENELCGVCAMN